MRVNRVFISRSYHGVKMSSKPWIHQYVWKFSGVAGPKCLRDPKIRLEQAHNLTVF